MAVDQRKLFERERVPALTDQFGGFSVQKA